MKKLKAISAVLTAILILVLLTLNTYASPAVYTNPSPQYENSQYHKNLMSVELTGDMRRDVIAVAVSQLYYREGNGEFDFPGLNPGSGNFVEFNYNFGKLDQEGNGVLTYGYPWCAAFVSFCLNAADIPKATVSRHVNCTTWLNNIKSKESAKVYTSAEYTPLMGDIIFFKTSTTSTRLSDHVGLVVAADDSRIYTIEGNASDSVVFKTYNKTDSKIIALVAPNYETEITDSHPDGSFAVNAQTALNMRKGPSTSYDVITTLANATEVMATEFQGSWAKVTHENQTGWVSATYLTPLEVMPITVEIEAGRDSTALTVMRGHPFSVAVPGMSGGKAFSEFTCDGIACGELDGDRIIFSFDKGIKLTATYSEPPAEESEAKAEPPQAAAPKESGCSSAVASAPSVIIISALGFMLVKKKKYK